MTSNGTDFFFDGPHVPVPPRMTPLVPAPLTTTPVVPTPAPAPALPTAPAVIERPVFADTNGDEQVSLDELLAWLAKTDGASDLHLISDAAPSARINGALAPIAGTGVIPGMRLEGMLQAIMNPRQRDTFAETNDIDLSYALGSSARFRVSILRARGKIGAVMRLVPSRIRTCDELAVSPHIRALAQLPRGLVLVTGPTGSGKSTLLAAILDEANRTRRAHILTLEDPIEFTHQSQMSVVRQREIHEDTESFASALRAALRQDPDIILVGEMRDLETTQAAIEAAQTGHLVFGTMHTNSAWETVSRAVNIFPKEVQNQIQTTLAACLEAVITQTLVRTIDGTGRTAAQEVMMLGPDSRNLIRGGKLEQLPNVLQTGLDRGMHTLNADLARLVKEGRVSYEEAAMHASDLTELDQKIGRAPNSRRVA